MNAPVRFSAPDGAVSLLRTLVVSDLAESTALVERLGDQRAAEVFRGHDRLVRDLIHRHGGQEIDKTDGFLSMFERPIQAVAFALAYQRALVQFNQAEGIALAARTGIHVGDVVVWQNAPEDIAKGAKPLEVEGLVKPVASRLMGLALPNQILLSGVAYSIAHRAEGELAEHTTAIRWRTHGRYRFKGVPEAVPVFEVGEEGIAPLKPPAWTGKAHRETPIWRRPLILGVEAMLALALLAIPAWYVLRPEPAIAFANRDWVVVGDLKNLTGDSRFDDALQAAFRIGLEQSRYVNVLSDLQVREVLTRMGRDPAATAIDRTTGSEVAQREGARALILPTIAEIGGRVRFTAEVVDPRTQATVYSDSADGRGADSVLPAMDELLRGVRGRLGESLASVEATSFPLEKVTTENIDALKAYSLAMQATAEGKGAEAIALLQQAVKLDDGFAQAWISLANIHYSIGQKGKAHEFTGKAMRDLGRLSARERLKADANAAWFEPPAAMRSKWTLYTQMYPDDAGGQQNLGLVAWWFENDLPEAVKEFRIVADSRHPRRGTAWLFLGDAQLAMGHHDDAAASFKRARELGSAQMNLQPVHLPIALRDFKGARAVLERESTHQFPYFEGEKQLRRTAIEIGLGRYGEARAAAAAAQSVATQHAFPAMSQRARMTQIALAFAQDDATAAKQLRAFVDDERQRLADAATTYDLSAHTHLTTAAVLALRNDERALAQRVLDDLQPAVAGSGYFSLEHPFIAAQCELSIDVDPGKAGDCLQRMTSDRAYFQTRVAVLRAQRAAGNDAAALAAAIDLAGHRDRAVAEWLGEYANQGMNLIAADDATVVAAELAHAEGDAARARSLLSPLIAAWGEADADLPLVQRARALDALLADDDEDRQVRLGDDVRLDGGALRTDRIL
jgi:putative peptide modification system cyclase